MSIQNEITRCVVFTDYHCAENSRLEVSVTMHRGKPTANLSMPYFPKANFAGADDITEPDLLRSYAACLSAAADEMERMK